jgi:hypothetical protein
MAGFINRGGITFAPGDGPPSRAVLAAQRKLNSGQTLTSAERVLLGMSAIPPSPTTSNFDPNFGSRASNRTSGTPPPPPAVPAPAAAPATVVEAAPAQTINAEPITISIPDSPKFQAVKPAPIDTVVFVDEAFSQEFITDLLFEDVAGQELLSIARDDTVNGQDVVYQPFKNLGILRDTYNINNLLKLQETSDMFFANFVIRLSDKIPKVGKGPDGRNYYYDAQTGEGIIEFINMRNDEQIEIQISDAGIIEEVGI